MRPHARRSNPCSLLPKCAEETTDSIGCLWREGYSGRAFLVPAAYPGKICVILHFYLNAGFEIACRGAFKSCLAVFFARRRYMAQTPFPLFLMLTRGGASSLLRRGGSGRG